MEWDKVIKLNLSGKNSDRYLYVKCAVGYFYTEDIRVVNKYPIEAVLINGIWYYVPRLGWFVKGYTNPSIQLKPSNSLIDPLITGYID